MFKTLENTRYESTAGPRQIKEVQQAESEFWRRSQSVIQIYDYGEPSEVWQPLGEPTQQAVDLWELTGARFDWSITRENFREVAAAIKEAAAQIEIPTEDHRTTDEEKAKRAAQAEENRRKEQERNDKAKEVEASIRDKAPADALGVIFAEYYQDESDGMTDYFGGRVTERVAIGWRVTKKESFKRLREAAATFEHTKDLGPGCNRTQVVALWSEERCKDHHAQHGFAGETCDEIFLNEDDARQWADSQGFADGYRLVVTSAENRDNYRGGGGNYLQAKNYGSGWRVRSELWQYARFDHCRDAIPTTEETTAAAVDGVEIQKRYHEKRAKYFWLVVLGQVSREAYEELRTRARQMGGWQSRKWKDSPSGFGFNSETDAAAFAATMEDGEGRRAVVNASNGAAVADRLDGFAEKLEEDARHNDRPLTQNPTPRRLGQLASRRHTAEEQREAAKACRNLAKLWRSGLVPDDLRSVRKKGEIEKAFRFWMSDDGAGLGASDKVKKYGDDSATAKALRKLNEDHETEEEKAEKAARDRAKMIEAKENDLRFQKVPGFFPTPRPVVDRMLDELGGNWSRMLEPSAGIGSIIEAARERKAGGAILYCEIRPSLREILALKFTETARGICDDFLELDESEQFDAIAMNPPFEKGQDVEHIQKAWRHLSPGGGLVALAGNGSGRAKLEAWIETLNAQGHDAWIEDVEPDAFQGGEAFRSTGVRACMVVAWRVPFPVGLPKFSEEDEAKEEETKERDTMTEAQEEAETLDGYGCNGHEITRDGFGCGGSEADEPADEECTDEPETSTDEHEEEQAESVGVVLGLDQFERNTILAALRLYQRQGYGIAADRPLWLHEIASGGDLKSEGLDAAAIDLLCEKIND